MQTRYSNNLLPRGQPRGIEGARASRVNSVSLGSWTCQNLQTILFELPHLPVFCKPGRGQTVNSLPDFRLRMIILRGACYVNNVPPP